MSKLYEWVADVYLQTDLPRDRVFDILTRTGLGTPQPRFTLRGAFIEISLGRNPDRTGESPFGLSPLVIEVARPVSAPESEFRRALRSLLKSLDKEQIRYQQNSD